MTFKKSLKSVATFVLGAGMTLNSMFVAPKIEAFPVEFYQQQCETYKENPLILRTLYLVLLMTHDKHALAKSQRFLTSYRNMLYRLFPLRSTIVREWEQRVEAIRQRHIEELSKLHTAALHQFRQIQEELAESILKKAREDDLLHISLIMVIDDIEDLVILTDQLGNPDLTPENYAMNKQQMEEKFLKMMKDMKEDAQYTNALKLAQQEIYEYLYGGSNPDEQCANEAANRLPTNPETLRKLCTDLLETIKACTDSACSKVTTQI